MKSIYHLQVIVYALILLSFSLVSIRGSTQPFFNSLAVLFRARPPRPNIYPVTDPNTNRFPGFGRQNTIPKPSQLIGSASTNRNPGILIAQPKKPTKFQFLPQTQTQQQHFSRPQQFYSGGPIPSTQNKFQPNTHSQFIPIKASNSQSHFSPIIATTPVSFPQQNVKEIVATTTAESFKKATVEVDDKSEDSVVTQDLINLKEDPEKPKLPVTNMTLTKVHFSKAFENGDVDRKPTDFRPSPMISESGGIDYSYARNNPLETNQDSKLSSSFSASDAKDIRYESGFLPVSYNQYASQYGTTASHEEYRNSYTQWNPPPPTTITTVASATIAPGPWLSTNSTIASHTLEMIPSQRDRGRYYDMERARLTTTAASSELVEDWVKPIKNNDEIHTALSLPHTKHLSLGKQSKFPVYNKNKPRVRVRPAKCEKFHRYGFCPVTPHYPLAQVERIASRCSALLAHIIAPLPKTEVHYDIVMTRNTSRKTPRLQSRQKPGKSKGWSWKEFRGSPVCDTEEIKITPGWAKNEDGEWLVILQTELWKQEAQISICSFAHDSPLFQRLLSGAGTKCVQRFTAQRLAVLDPENSERCPLIRSVFLPSACICLSEKGTSASLEESTVGSVTPNFSSSEEDKLGSGSGEHSFLMSPPPPTARITTSANPILIQNGTFTTTLVVTENSPLDGILEIAGQTPSPI